MEVRKVVDGPVAGFAPDKSTWVVQLNGSVTLRRLHRFVAEHLKEGLRYRDLASRVLADVLFTAATHPCYRYMETGRNDPIWLLKLKQLELAPSQMQAL